MKRFLLTFIMLLSVGWLTAQNVSNGQVFRIADNTTTFDKNIPVGTLIYDVGGNATYICKTAAASTLTLTTGSANFELFSTGGALDLSYNSGTHAIDITGGGNSAVIPLADADGATEGLASFTAADFEASGGNISIDYTNAQAANTTTKGFLTSTDWNTFNDKLGAGDVDLAVGTRAATTMEVTNSGGDNVTLPAANTTEAGLMTDTQFDKLAAIEGGAEVNLTPLTEKFEETTSGVGGDNHSLGQTAVTANGCRVSLNGATLDPATYTLTTTTITIDIQVYQYDEVVITYWY